MAERVWVIRDALTWTVDYFERSHTEEPRRSAEWLLSSVTGLSRLELYAQHDRPLSDEERAAYRAAIERRAAGEPLQYVTGEMPFRHLVVHVCPGVFIPRPETEVLVDEALGALEGVDAPLVVDLCTGSGAVALSIAHERSDAQVTATDLSALAVETASENATRCGVAGRVRIFEGDLFAPLPSDLRGRVDAVVANPPYIPSADLSGLPAEVTAHEPVAALDGGPDGLETVRRIAAEARAWLRPGGSLVVETDTNKAKEAANTMAAWYEGIRVVRDLTGRDRIVIGRAREAGETS